MSRSKLGLVVIVCSCNVLSDRDVRACMNQGPECPRTPAQVYRCLGCSPQCGRCARTIRAIMDEALPAGADTSCAGCSSTSCSHHDDALSRGGKLRELAL